MRKTNIIMAILLFLFSHTGCGSFAQQGTESYLFGGGQFKKRLPHTWCSSPRFWF